jgi:hypothetical protein
VGLLHLLSLHYGSRIVIVRHRQRWKETWRRPLVFRSNKKHVITKQCCRIYARHSWRVRTNFGRRVPYSKIRKSVHINMCPETFNLRFIAESVRLKWVFRMSSMRFNARLDTCHHGPLHPLQDAKVVADSLTGVHNATVKCFFRCQQKLHTQWFSGVPTGRNPEDSSQASVEATQWVLLYLSIGNSRCHWEHLAQHG